MAIKNYTTTIDVYKSLGEIQGALASHGARKVMVDYDGAGNPTGVTFGIETPEGPRGFLLPANVDGVRAVFARQKVKRMEQIHENAKLVALPRYGRYFEAKSG